MGYGAHLKSMQSLGYKQMSAHVSGALSFDEARPADKEWKPGAMQNGRSPGSGATTNFGISMPTISMVFSESCDDREISGPGDEG